MPENINDTPARREQVEDYKADPTRPSAKPYSSKQLAGMAEVASKIWLYHPTEKPRIFHKDEVSVAVADGWSDVPFKHPNNPNHVHPSAGVTSPAKAAPDSDLEFLRKQATNMGIKIDSRWGEKRLTEEINKKAKAA